MTGDGPNASGLTKASQSDDDGNRPDSQHIFPPAKRDRLTRVLTTLGKVLAVVVTLVTLAGATATVLFQIDPRLEPCVGGSEARFTAIQVAPNYSLAQYLRDVNHQHTPAGLPPLMGAEIRYNYSASNLSGKNTRLYATLEEVLPDGDISAPPGPAPSPTSSENLQPQAGLPNEPPPVVRPNTCSQDSSGLDWIELPENHRSQHHRYRIVLEFYRGPLNTFTDRVGVGETAIFDS